MAKFLVSYDQHRDRDYTRIWTLLRQWGAKRILESLWLVDLNSPSAEAREAIRAVTNDEDSILVIQLTPGAEWSSYAAQAEGVAWLEANIRNYQSPYSTAANSLFR